ncbi:MAG TPA: transcriptional regulator [Ktedonobacteraceae bacterium]|jgi:DNA-binding MarR family transcriptional regulator|nr:transcriptional regulator [Ktedonobacteraceae bacterium]
MAVLNEVIHQPVRLRLMAMLTALHPETQVVFSYLKDTLELTDGNLGAHLHKLEEAGYVIISKTFVRNKPQTYIQATEAGRQAFAEHTAALREILESGQQLAKNGATNVAKGQIS